MILNRLVARDLLDQLQHPTAQLGFLDLGERLDQSQPVGRGQEFGDIVRRRRASCRTIRRSVRRVEPPPKSYPESRTGAVIERSEVVEFAPN
jgi:hypothetical protein